MNEKKIIKGLYYAFIDSIRKVQWVMLVGLFCAMVTFVVVNETFVPLYSSSTTYIIRSKSSGNNPYSNLVAAEKLLGPFDAVLNSQELSSIILADTNWEKIPGTITSKQITDTNILVVTVSADSPRNAYLYMSKINEKGMDIMKNIADDAVISIFRQPTVPLNSYNSSGAISKSLRVGILGAVIAFALYMFLSYTRPYINFSEQLKQMNTVVLDSLPYEGKFRISNILKKKSDLHLINGIDCSFGYVESIKNIRRKIKIKDGSDSASVVVSSANAGEGKSTVAANIAISIAQRGKKVALVDLDIYNPSQYKLFGNKKTVYNRIEDFIFSKEGFDGQVNVDPITGIVMFFGTPSARSRRTFPTAQASALVEYLKKYVEYIIVDTPPVALFADASEITDFTDYSLLVVREHHSLEDEIIDSSDTIKSGKAEFLGCVYNCARFDNAMSVGYGYGYGYGKYRYGYYKHYGYGSDNSDDEILLPEEDSMKIKIEEEGDDK